jgi:hypothetical protein
MFMFVVLVVEQCTTIVDHLFFFFFESVWRGPYSAVYYLHSMHGPLGHFMTIVVIVNAFDTMAVPQAIPNYRKVVTIIVAILFLYTSKSYWQRRHFVGLLELRFRDKLRAIDTCQRILSLLSQPLLATATRSPIASHQAVPSTGRGQLKSTRRVGELSPIPEQDPRPLPLPRPPVTFGQDVVKGGVDTAWTCRIQVGMK